MLQILKQAWQDFNEDNCARIASSLAYAAAFSLAPLLILVISICQLVFEPEDIRGQVEADISSFVGEEGAQQVKSMIENDAEKEEQGILATITGIVIILVGATGFFVQLQNGMNDVWEVQPDPERSGWKYFIMKRLLSLGMILTVAFLVFVSLVASTVLSSFDTVIDSLLPGMAASSLMFLANLLVSFVMMTALFAAMFQVLPDAEIKWKDVLVGATGTAILFLIGKYGIAFYLSHKSMETTYGAAGSLVVILMWVYYSSMILLFGAEFTQAWAIAHGEKAEPSQGAVRAVKKTEIERE